MSTVESRLVRLEARLPKPPPALTVDEEWNCFLYDLARRHKEWHVYAEAWPGHIPEQYGISDSEAEALRCIISLAAQWGECPESAAAAHLLDEMPRYDVESPCWCIWIDGMVKLPHWQTQWPHEGEGQ